MFERTAGWIARQAQKHAAYGAANPFLEGPFAPVAFETTETNLRVTGSIPRELNGLYARIGPNPMEVANPAIHHWFLGDGMVHGVRLRDGQAQWYRSRWIGTDGVNQRLGRPAAGGLRHRDLSTVNTNVLGHAGRIWALVEGGALPVELDADLETRGHGLFNTGARRAFAAHPRRDPRTGDLHAVCYDVMVQDSVSYVVIGADGQLRRDVAIPVLHGPMIHDCALTDTRVVILDLPITFSMGALLRGATFPFQWNKKHQARVGLLPRDGTADDIAWFEVDPCFAFHASNAYDRADGCVVLDLITYPRMFDGAVNGPEKRPSAFQRWVIGNGRVARETFSDFQQEFPRCDDRRIGQPYRFAYTVGIDVPVPKPEPLYRYDMHTGAIIRHDFGPNHLPGEVVFVPRQPDSAEDDGSLLSFVYDLAADSSTLTILDAANLGGEPTAVVHLPVRVPLGFHGNWIGDAV
jgi:carotenoid cleavage dioxygenase